MPKTTTRTAKNGPQRTTAQLMLAWVGVLAVAALGVAGWQWRATLLVEQVVVEGQRHAAADALRTLARVDTTQHLYTIAPDTVADRVAQHPWVEYADVRRMPTGTLVIDVTERTPVLLVLGVQGRPYRYLDAEGYQMPFVPGVAYDVPLLRGVRLPEHPSQPVRHRAVLALARDLPTLTEAQDALLSDFVWQDGDLWVHTSPITDRSSIPVRLGTDGFAEKIQRLHAYWHQAVLPRPQTHYELIDLRFAGQIVTREPAS